MKAVVYNPYLDTLGGGELYSVAVATTLRDAGFAVEIEWRDAAIKDQLQTRFGLDLRDISIVSDIERGEGSEVCFWLSDGSIPLLRAKCNLLHFQVPFHDVNGRSLMNKMKLYRISKIISNSEFTKKIVDKEYAIDSCVIYPPVNTAKIRAKRKENIILFVGRFSQLKQSKNQHLLISSFKRLGLADWRLVLAGGVEVGAGEYLDNLKKSVKNYPIDIKESPDFEELADIYGRAKIFWSAVGFGADELKEPERFEHFGITLVEAMAAGCLPLVYEGGGYLEIINEDCGFLWTKQSELVKITRNIATGPYAEWKKISMSAIERSQAFSNETFSKKLLSIIKV